MEEANQEERAWRRKQQAWEISRPRRGTYGSFRRWKACCGSKSEGCRRRQPHRPEERSFPWGFSRGSRRRTPRWHRPGWGSVALRRRPESGEGDRPAAAPAGLVRQKLPDSEARVWKRWFGGGGC